MMGSKDIALKPRPVLECLLLLALATVFRTLFIGKTDLGGDESFSLYMALQRPVDIVKMLCRGDNPPLWELLLHGWIKLFGISEVAIRSLSLIFSVLTVIPIYFIGERHIQRLAGFTAALCYCCSTFSIFLAHECRVYSLVACSAAFSVWLFLSAIKEPKPWKFVLMTLVNLTLMYGHYLSVWVIVMEFLVVLFIKPIRQRIWKPYFTHAIALIVLFTPMFPVLFTRFMASGVNGTWIAKSTGLEELYNMMMKMCNAPIVTVIAMGIMVAAFIRWIVLAVQKKYTYETGALIHLLWVVPLMVSFVLSFFTGFLLDRYFYFLFPIFYLSLGACCVSLFPRNKGGQLMLVSFMSLMMFVSCEPDSSTKRFSGWHYDIKPIVNQIVEAKNQGQTLVILPEYFDKQFVYYLDEGHEAFRTQSEPTNYYVYRNYLMKEGYYYDYNYREADMSRYTEMIYPFQKDMPMEGVTEYVKSLGFRLVKVVEEPPYEVWYYSAAPSSLP